MIRSDRTTEQGYVFIYVIVFMMIIGILGVTVLQTVIFSNRSAMITEDGIRAQLQAENALRRFEAELGVLIEDYNQRSRHSISVQRMIAEIRQSVLALGECNEQLSLEVRMEPLVQPTQEHGTYTELITVISRAQVASRLKTVTKTYTLSTVTGAFQFAVASGSHIELNGAVWISGDVSAGGGLVLSKRGQTSQPNASQWIDTAYPSLYGTLYSGGKYYVRQFGPTDHRLLEIAENQLHNYFASAPAVSGQTAGVEPLPVTEYIRNRSKPLPFQQTQNGAYVVNRDETIATSLKIEHKLVIQSGKTLYVNGDLTVGTLEMQGNSTLIVNGHVYVTETEQKQNQNQKDVLTGTIVLGSNKYMYFAQDAYIDSLQFTGEMYVAGSLYVTNALNMKGTIYVGGSTTIDNFNNASGGKAVIISEGDVTVANQSSFAQKAQTIDAYLYSNHRLEIFGIEANLHIRGGVYGNPVVLNAVKGEISRNYFLNSELAGSRYDPIYIERSQSTLSNEASRLKIEYNPDIMLNPPQGIPAAEGFTLREVDTTIE